MIIMTTAEIEACGSAMADILGQLRARLLMTKLDHWSLFGDPEDVSNTRVGGVLSNGLHLIPQQDDEDNGPARWTEVLRKDGELVLGALIAEDLEPSPVPSTITTVAYLRDDERAWPLLILQKEEKACALTTQNRHGEPGVISVENADFLQLMCQIKPKGIKQ